MSTEPRWDDPAWVDQWEATRAENARWADVDFTPPLGEAWHADEIEIDPEEYGQEAEL